MLLELSRLLDVAPEDLNRALLAAQQVFKVMGFLHFLSELTHNFPWLSGYHILTHLHHGFLLLLNDAVDFDVFVLHLFKLCLEDCDSSITHLGLLLVELRRWIGLHRLRLLVIISDIHGDLL